LKLGGVNFWYFKLKFSDTNRIHGLKYQNSHTPSCKDMGLKNQSLW